MAIQKIIYAGTEYLRNRNFEQRLIIEKSTKSNICFSSEIIDSEIGEAMLAMEI